MRKVTFRMGRIAVLVAVMGIFSASASGQNGWPLHPAGNEHPIGTTLGEFINSSDGAYQHYGVDILGSPGDLARVAVGGVVIGLVNEEGSTTNWTAIRDDDGIIHRYGHLEYGTYDADYEASYILYTEYGIEWKVSPGDPIAKLVSWGSSGFHHLHYDLNTNYDGDDPKGDWLNPMAHLPPPTPPPWRITPNPDPDLPEINSISFAEDNASPWDSATPWIEFPTASPGHCTTVKGKTDIIVQARDRDDANSSLTGVDTLWVYAMRWRACPDSNPLCPWNETYVFDRMPLDWKRKGNPASKAYFSYSHPWISNSNYYFSTWLYAIVTNFTGGMPDVGGAWDTTTTAYPDGNYTVTVELVDFAGNSKMFNERVCVDNGSGCGMELSIQDGHDDRGAIPYLGEIFWESPGIKVNRGTPDEDRNILVGAANTIEVTVWNYGCDVIPEGTEFDLSLGWGPPSPTLPSANVIKKKPLKVAPGGWPAGYYFVEPFDWTPAAGSIPFGHSCLKVWVDSPNDPMQSTVSVQWDDNQAQRNITFVPAPATPPPSTPPPSTPGTPPPATPPAAGGTPAAQPAEVSFWLNPLQGVQDRGLDLNFSYSGIETTIQGVEIHVAPGMFAKEIRGGYFAASYQGEPARGSIVREPFIHGGDIPSAWQKAAGSHRTVIIGGIDPGRRLRLQGIEIQKPLQIQARIRSTRAAQGRYADIHVVEYGRLPGHDEVTRIGGLTLRIEH